MAALTEAEERAALGLAAVDGVGPKRFGWLVDEHGSARAALEAVRRGAPPPPRTPAKVGAALRRARPATGAELGALRGEGIRVVSYGSSAYPDRLRRLERPPALLYLRGPLGLPSEHVVTIVGTRAATGYGRRMAGDLAREFAEAGWTVLSGLARGVDGAAHRGALDAGGATVGVLGHGLDHVFPRSHRPLFRRMEEHGLLASEFPPSEPPRRLHFPARNRILAALADAVVVVQAGRGSGALITAELALELGCEVHAVPGPVGPDASVGVHELLRDGASPVTCAADVLGTQELRTAAARRSSGGVSRDRLARIFGGRAGLAAAVCRALEAGARPADELVEEGVVTQAEARGLLARLELEGFLDRLPGDRWTLREPDEDPAGTRAGSRA